MPKLNFRHLYSLVLTLLCSVVITHEQRVPVDQVELLVERGAPSSWWFANIKRQGKVAYNSNSSYVLYRNVADFGTYGDGIHDDTQALTNAMFLGPRCIGDTPKTGCDSSTIQPALVYIPPGTYLISAPVIMPYNTIVMGDAHNMPTLLAAPTFDGLGLLDPDPYYSGGASWYANQNNFFRQVRNIRFDITQTPYTSDVHCIHWQVAQATSLQNIVFDMHVGGGAANRHQGIFMDNGSGGMMRDLVFNGGGIGFFLGNQQFTSTNLTFNNCYNGVYMNWDWIWVFRDTTFNNCEIGIYMAQKDDPSVGSAVLADSAFRNVARGIVTSFRCNDTNLPSAGTLVIDNVDFTGANVAVSSNNGTVILPGGSIVPGWMQGHVYSAYYGQQFFPNHNNQTCYIPKAPRVCVQGRYDPPKKPGGLLDASGKLFDRAKPAYTDFSTSQFVSAKDHGCIGDGLTDDTVCLQNLFTSVAWDQIAYIDNGAYIVTQPIFIPPNIRILGEAWPKIMIKSSGLWDDPQNPAVVFKVGNKGDVGHLEIQDIVFETIGPVPGAILMEWNLEEDAQGSAGMWDVHWRIGGSAGTELQMNCKKDPVNLIEKPEPTCYAAFLILHITKTASLYMENNWGWVADHELDQAPRDQINIWNGRGLLVESVRPVWIIGGSFEHSQLYNYQIANGKNIYLAHIQSETAYMQDNPIATLAYSPNADWYDPNFTHCRGLMKCIKTWGLRVYNSTYVYIYGAGLYSFFQNYDSSCLVSESCQTHAASIELSEAVYIYALYSIGHTNLVMMDFTPLVPQGDNGNTFGQSIALFEYD